MYLCLILLHYYNDNRRGYSAHQTLRFGVFFNLEKTQTVYVVSVGGLQPLSIGSF